MIVAFIVKLLARFGWSVAASAITPWLWGAALIGLAGVGAFAYGWHTSQVSAAWDAGAAAAKLQCSYDAANARQRAEVFYRTRALRLEAELARLRANDQKVEDLEASTQGLEAELARMKSDPVCWTPGVVKELYK